MATRIQQRRGTAAQWASANPVLAAGESGYETDTGVYKIGDGTTAWTSLTPAGRGSFVDLARTGIVQPATISYADIQAAATTAAANGTRLVAAGTITTSSTLTIKSDADLSGLTYNYTGTGVAVQVGAGTSGTILFRKDIRLPDIINTSKVGTGWAGSTVGVQATNTYGCTIRVGHVKGFVTGYYAYGLGTGNVYNDVLLLHMENNKRNLVVGAGTGGWSNSNTYRLGLLTQDSAEGTSVAGTRNILVETATNLVNGNLFIGGSVEGNVAEYHLDCDGLYNRFDAIRWENSGGCRVIWQANSSRNDIMYGYTAQSLVETHVTGSSLNRINTTGMSRIVGSTTKAVQWLENTSSSTAGADAIMDPGATLAGSDPTTAYRILRAADFTKMKRATDTNDRLMLDHTNGRVYFGNAAGAISMYLAAVSTSGISINAGNFYFSPDNTNDLGSASLRPRYIYAGTAFKLPTFATGSRPTASSAGAGAMVYDTTLSKPIWSDGTNWKDAAGTTV